MFCLHPNVKTSYKYGLLSDLTVRLNMRRIKSVEDR